MRSFVVTAISLLGLTACTIEGGERPPIVVHDQAPAVRPLIIAPAIEDLDIRVEPQRHRDWHRGEWRRHYYRHDYRGGYRDYRGW